MPPPPSIIELSKYLSAPYRYVHYASTSSETEQVYERPVFWSGRSCLAVVCYVLKFCFNSNSNQDDHISLTDTIRRLNDLASQYEESTKGYPPSSEWLEKERKISEIFVNTLMPKVQRFFKVPKLQDFPADTISSSSSIIIPKRNEILAAFIHFLLQIMNSEEDQEPSRHKFPWFVGRERSIQEELTFLLTYLGDIPFQESTEAEVEEVNNLLTDLEIIANEAGSFIYSYFFTFRPINKISSHTRASVLFEKIDILNARIVKHCTNFSMMCSGGTSKATAIDSVFIVDSLLEDINDIMNGRSLSPDRGTNAIDDIKTLHQLLNSARSFLKDINVVQDTEIEELKECTVRIRDMGYEAEYLINSFMGGNVPVWYLNLRLPNVIQKFELITTGYNELKNSYGVKVLRNSEDSAAVPSDAIESSMVDDIVVGFDEERKKILDKLTGGSEKLQIISIFGMPGIGKTTLAKKLYNDRLVFDYFDARAWCVVSRTYNRRNVLMDLLMSSPSKPDKETLLYMNDESLAIKIQETLTLLDGESLATKTHRTLIGRRYLIVMDDVWSSDVWDDLRRYFPNNGNGSRILFTSRIRDVVPVGSIIHTLPLLSHDQCLELLVKKVFRHEPCPSQLIETGKQIAVKCSGLPLAVVVMAGILSKMEKEEGVWKEVEESLDFHTSNCMKILELSYKHLPDHLKLCFLYLGVFPENSNIPVKKLLMLWIAEGFIPKEEEKSREKVAKIYLMELINRSLVMIAKNRSIGGTKACSIHDLLRDMCLRKAHEENFLNLIKDDRFSIYEKHHRLCVNSAARGYLRPVSLHCRSFFGYLPDPSSCLSQMKLLRVMELSRNDVFYYRLSRIDHLVSLRYLVVDRMPEPIVGYLNNLEFLRVDNTSYLNQVPSIILKMPKLKHFHVRLGAKFDDDCDTSRTNNLDSLSVVCIYTDKDYQILRASPYLRKLKCVCKPILPDLRFLAELESLNIVVRYNTQIPSNPTEIFFPSSIKKLSLSGTRFLWEMMSIIGRLPNLQVLKLLKNAFDGEKWETGGGEFQELKFLKLDSLKLKNWYIDSSEHFPKLGHLVLHKCEEIQNIPIELGDIMTLVEMIEVYYCGYEASLSAVRIEQQQLENGNEELKVIITNYEWSKEQLVHKYREEIN